MAPRNHLNHPAEGSANSNVAASLRRSRRRWLAVCVAAVLASGCSCEDESKPQQPSVAKPVSLAPVPAPAGLVADLYVPAPDETWGRLRALGGARAALMPASYQMLAATLLGMPPTAATNIDKNVPLVGAILEGEKGAFTAVLGMHLRSGRETVAALTKGSDARYREQAGKDGMVTLEPVQGKAAKTVALAVVGNYLLASPSRAAVEKAGPYVARTLPKQPAPKEPIVVDIKESALKGTLAKRLRDAWKMQRDKLEQKDLENRKEKGRAPDFGDPAAAMLGVTAAVDDIVAVLEDSKRAQVVVRPGGDHLEAFLEIEPKAGGAAAARVQELAVGNLQPLTQLPKATSFAVLTRSTPKSRAAGVQATLDSFVKLFGERFPEADQKKAKKVLADLAAGRGDYAAYGVGVANGKLGVAFLTPTANAKAFGEGAKGAFDLLELKAFAEPLKRFAGSTTIQQGTTKVEGHPDAIPRVLVKLKPSKQAVAVPSPPGTPKGAKGGQVGLGAMEIQVMWLEKGGVIHGAAGFDAPATLAGLLDEAPASKLAAETALAGATKRAGSEVSLACVIRPGTLSKLTRGGGSAQAPVLLTLGRKGNLGTVRVDAAKGAVMSLVRMLTGI